MDAVAAEKAEWARELKTRFEQISQLPRTTLTVSAPPQVTHASITDATRSLFLPYIREDLARDELARADSELTGLEQMLHRPERGAKPGLFLGQTATTSTGRQLKVEGGSIVTVTNPSKPVFLTGYGVFQRLRDDIEKLPSVGANLIQVEIGPSEIFPKPGAIDRTPLERLLAVMDRAAKVGVVVDVLLSPHYFPQWMREQEPSLVRHRKGFVQYCIHHPAGREFLRLYVRTVMGAIKDHPALFSVCIANEPVNIEEPCEVATHDWHLWLTRHHGSFANFKSSHHTRAHSFAEVPLPNPFHPPAEQALWLDFIRFNQEEHADWLKLLSDAVHSEAAHLPVHIKAGSYKLLGYTNEPESGLDPTLLSHIGEINGNDGLNFYVPSKGNFAQRWLEYSMGHDLQRSLKLSPVFNSENHLIVDRETHYIPPRHIRTALWQEAIHGQSATTLWIWDRTFSRSRDSWGSLLERPEAVEAVGHVNLDLNRAATEVSTLQRAPSKILLLHSVSSQVWEPDTVSNLSKNIYTALSFFGVKVGFVTERQLEAREMPSLPLLIVPGNIHLSRLAIEQIARYRGRLIFVGSGKLLSRDDHDRPIWTRLHPQRLAMNGDQNEKQLWLELQQALPNWGIEPEFQLLDPEGHPLWGVEWSSVNTPDGTWLLNLCNYLHSPVTLELHRNGHPVATTDVLSGEKLPERFELQSLETRLLHVD